MDGLGLKSMQVYATNLSNVKQNTQKDAARPEYVEI